MNVTLFESQIMAVIAFSEMTTANGSRPKNSGETLTYLWVDEFGEAVGKTGSQVKGVVSTLSKKGMAIVVEESDDSSSIQLTDEGYKLFSTQLCPTAVSFTVALEEIEEYFKDKPTNNQKAECKRLPFCDEAGFASRDLVEAADMKDLLAYYNANVPADKMIKKFADQKTAVKKVLALLAAQLALGGDSEAAKKDDAVVKAKENGAPVHKTRKTRATKVEKAKAQEPDPEENDLSEEEWEEKMRAQLAGTEPDNSEPTGRASNFKSNSASIAASWGDSSVKAARLTRNGVTVSVNGKTTEHKSVRAAFAEYSLPDSKHIRFRLKLKEAKTAIFEHNGIQYLFNLQ